MNITAVEDKLSKCGLKLERLYNYLQPNLAILHQEAVKDFLKRDITHYEFYCDMKRFQSLEVGDIAFVIYGSNLVTGGGFQTEVKLNANEIELAYLFKQGLVETVLVFELTHRQEPFSAPAGKVYKLIK